MSIVISKMSKIIAILHIKMQIQLIIDGDIANYLKVTLLKTLERNQLPQYKVQVLSRLHQSSQILYKNIKINL